MHNLTDTPSLDERRPVERPSLLAVSPVSPWPIRDGFTLRGARLLQELARDWRITLVAPAAPQDADPAPIPLESRVEVSSDGGPVAVPSPSERDPIRRAVERARESRRFSAALLWAGTEFLARDLEELPPAVADRIDCMTLMSWRNRAQRSSLRERLSALRGLAEAASYERAMARRLAATVVVGEDDASTLRRLSGVDSIHVVPNGVDLDGLPDPDAKALVPTVIFTGVLSYSPNIQAVRHLVREVWPGIRSGVPDAILEVVGRSPTAEVRELTETPGVRLRADVPDMRAVQRRAWVSVAPMRSGSGIKNKVLEAWAAGTPVVMTPMATNGLRLDETMSELVTDDPGRMATAVMRLLRDGSLRERRGAEVYAVAARHHSWKGAADRVSGLLRTVSGGEAVAPRVA